MPGLSDLPAPGAEALAHSERLSALMCSEIAAQGGAISFARYMELALYAPGLGYYSAGARKFGRDGDFITAPELSPLFARCLARQCAQVLQELGQGDILEIGAGSGVMACDLLRELAASASLPTHYFILETSAELRARQRATVQKYAPELLDRVVWLTDFPPVGWRGVVVANELLDAMPVHLFRKDTQGVRERLVGWEDDGFVWRNGDLSDPDLLRQLASIEAESQEHTGAALPCAYQSEINLAAQAWLFSLAERMAAGLILLIDYGYPRREYYHPERKCGTLMCHYRHRAHDNPLILPGLQDITSHVDFTALAETASVAGLSVAGYTTQASFLLACGLLELATGFDDKNLSTSLKQAQAIKKLTLPGEMGELFKVIALTRDVESSLLGFRLSDLRGRL